MAAPVEVKKKRGGPKGPRKVKETYLVYRMVNGALEVVNVTKDAFAILAATKADDSINYVDVTQFFQKPAKAA